MRETIKLCSIVIGILSAIIGGGVAISGYLGDLEKRPDDRKKQTFQLINLFYSDGLMRARTAVLQNEKEIAESEAGFSLDRPYGHGLEKPAGRPASIAYNCSKS
jgi:hypothetical protein